MSVDFKEYARRMDKALDHLEEEFGAVRAGRANAKVLDRITVEYYGSETPLNGVATISTPDARTLVVQPWDTKLLKDIQKAIQTSDLGINPQNDGRVIRLVLPQLTEAFVTEPNPPVTEKFISAEDGCFYAQQQCNGTWVIGGDSNYEIYDATYPREVTFSFSAPRIARFFLEYMPTLKNVKVIRSWSGQLDMCWDGCPVISPVEEVPGLYIGCAFTGHGFGIGPAAGYVLAQMAVGEPPVADLSGLRYDRFRLPSHGRIF